MIRVLFLCHGNICRSPMAEFVFKKIVLDNNMDDEFFIDSKALTSEEIGNDMYYLAKRELDNNNIKYSKRSARLFKKEDYDYFDYIIIMDEENRYDINYIIRDKDNKVKKLLYYIGSSRDVSDPWYTRDFSLCYKDIYNGCMGLFEYITSKI